MPIASIIIRTLNEATHLGELLSNIAAQQLYGLDSEVVLVDSGSTDGTMEIARQFGCKIVTITREEFSFGRSLNVGCEASAGDFLVFVSGHCIPVDCTWLQRLCEPLMGGVVSYVYGRQVGGQDTKFSERQIFARYFPAQSQIPQAGFYCNNANAALLRSAWEEIRFDEELTGLEDMHLAKQLVERGQKVGYVAESAVYHLHNETWPQVRRRFEREAIALQKIMPHVHVRQRDVLRYVLSSVRMDFARARAEAVLARNAVDIIRYRVNQYLGSYLGNRIHQELSHYDKERYFYPDGQKLVQRHTQSGPTTVSEVASSHGK